MIFIGNSFRELIQYKKNRILPSSTSTQLNSIQLKLRLRWSIFPLNPATHPATRPPNRNLLNFAQPQLNSSKFNSTQIWGWEGLYFHFIQSPTHPHILHLTQSTNHPPTRISLNFQFVLVSRTLISILILSKFKD